MPSYNPRFESFLSEILTCNVKFTENPEEANCVTHGGNFHADETFCNVFFGKFLKEAIVFRSGQNLPEKEVLKPDVFIYDTGFGNLDHHQKGGNGTHPSSNTFVKHIPYASFGLVWKNYGKSFCDRIAKAYGNVELSQFLWDFMEENLVMGIDAADNGIYPRSPFSHDPFRVLSVSNILTLFTPLPTEKQDYSVPLKTANELASLIFDSFIKRGIWYFENSNFCNSDYSFQEKNKAQFIFAKIFMKHFISDITNAELNRIVDKYSIEFPYHTCKLANLREKEPIPTSAFGILWEIYGKEYCQRFSSEKNTAEYIWDFVKTELVMGVDAHANGIMPETSWNYLPYTICSVADFLEILFPLNADNSCFNNSFKTAYYWADRIFERIIKKAIDRISTREYVEEKIEASSYHTMILDSFVHWQEWLIKSDNPKAKDIWFVIFHSNKGIYNIQPVPYKNGPNGFRKGFPKAWYGCNSDELCKISKIPTASFVHDQGFIGGAEDLIGAILMVLKSIEAPN